MDITTEVQNLCTNVKYLRRKNRLSKKEMARRIGIGTGSLTKMERGELPPRVNCKIFLQIYFSFGITPAKMLKSHLWDEE